MGSDIESKGVLGLKSRPFFLRCQKLHLLEELLYSLAGKQTNTQIRRLCLFGEQVRKGTLDSLCFVPTSCSDTLSHGTFRGRLKARGARCLLCKGLPKAPSSFSGPFTYFLPRFYYSYCFQTSLHFLSFLYMTSLYGLPCLAFSVYFPLFPEQIVHYNGLSSELLKRDLFRQSSHAGPYSVLNQWVS